jgi:hypothetical protein
MSPSELARAPRLVRALVGTAVLVVVAGMALSYDALAVLAREAGIDPVLSWGYPAVVDGVLVVGSIAAYVLRGARLRIRMYLWLLIAAAVVVSVAGNAAHALSHGGSLILPVVAAALVSAVPPASMAAVIHVLIVLMHALPKMAGAPERRADDLADVRGHGHQAAASPVMAMAASRPNDVNGHDRVDGHGDGRANGRGDGHEMTADEARRAVIALLRRGRKAGRPVTVEDVRRVTGRSDRQARRILAGAREPDR